MGRATHLVGDLGGAIAVVLDGLSGGDVGVEGLGRRDGVVRLVQVARLEEAVVGQRDVGVGTLGRLGKREGREGGLAMITRRE